MGGTLRGKIDCYSNTLNQYNTAQCVFKGLYDFFKSHPNMTEIARNGGSGGSASSVDYYDETNPFKHLAWYVFRMNDATLENGSANPTGYSGPRTFPWYVHVVFYRADGGQNVNASPAAPCLIEGATNPGGSNGVIGIQFAIPVGTIAGTSEVAWNGGGTLGANTKGTPVWKTTAGSPSGFQGTFVFPRSSNLGGSHATSRENCSTVLNTGATSPVRYHFLADDDDLILLTNVGDDASTWALTYFGLYTVRPGITINYPMVQISSSLPITTVNNVYGPTTGVAPGGGIPWNSVSTESVRGVITSRYDEFFSAYAAPNKMFPSEQFDEWKIPVISYESPSFYGYAGEIDLIREVFGFSPHDANVGRTRAAFGANSPFGVKLTVPWNGSTVPRSNFTRAGITFP